MTSQFDSEGRYFAKINEDGILKIWDTASNSLEQEYVPDIHLASPCTCLQFVECFQNFKNESPKHKRRKTTDSSTEIVIGTTSGKLLIYSISKGGIKCTIDGSISLPVSCLSPNYREIVYSGLDQNVVAWNIQNRTVLSEWKAGSDIITAIVAVPKSNRLLTASKSIKLWNLENHTLLKTFLGHSSNVNFLHSIPNNGYINTESKYVISGSKSDRLLNCWNISDEVEGVHTTATLLLDDYVTSISLSANEDGSTKLSAALANGRLHLFQVTLNGECTKPLKPKSTIMVVADNNQKKDAPIYDITIVSSHLQKENSLLIAHGSSVILKFERIQPNNKKTMCLIREHPHTQKQNDIQTDKVINPLVGNNATYLTPFTNIASVTKRKLSTTPGLSFLKRLENLSNQKEESAPRSNNMAHLLLQGLRSKDKNIIRTVLLSTNKPVVRNTIRRLPINVICELIKQLEILIQGTDNQTRAATVWLEILLDEHSTLLNSNPDLPVIMGPIRSYIKSRLLSRNYNIKKRLGLVFSQQLTTPSNKEEESEDEALIFNDRDSDSSSDDQEEVEEDDEDSQDIGEEEEDEDSQDIGEEEDEDSQDINEEECDSDMSTESV